ncbi:MAG: hypothetical protein JNK82_29080 [Myxococcaceae bacterium]|nr:hypothetical protein [Myxococcaceae bacterium]
MRGFTACPDDRDISAVVTVLDPNNMPVDLGSGSKPEVVRNVELGTYSVVIETTPALPGPYHFIVRFEPAFGTEQVDVYVAENRLDATPDLVVGDAAEALARCPLLDVSAGGDVVCLSTGVVFGRDGGTPGALGGRVVRDGPVYWVAGDTGVSRWLERDGGFELSARSTAIDCDVLAPWGGDVFCAADRHLARIGFADGGLVWGSSSWQPPVSPRALWRQGDTFILTTPNEFCTGDFTDGGVCESASASLFMGDYVVVGNEPTGLSVSVRDGRRDAKSLVRVRAKRQLSRVELPEGWLETGAGTSWGASPAFRSDAGLWLVGDDAHGEPLFQRYPELPFIGATTRWVAFRWGGGVALFRR